eukprot:g3230.t1
MSSVADNNNSKELNFDNKQWEDAEFAQMIAEIKVNTVVTELSLKNCLGPKQAKIIAEMLMVNASLKKINLQSNNIGDEGASAIAKGIQENKNCVLEELNLYRNKIKVEGAKSLAEMIKVNASLKNINLLRNEIGDEGASAIAKGIQENKNCVLEEL